MFGRKYENHTNNQSRFRETKHMSRLKSSTTIIKKSVSLNPLLDFFVRKTWAILIDKGYNVSYSTALNYMLLTALNSVINQGIDERTSRALMSFLKDQKSIKRLDFKALIHRYQTALEEL